MKRIADAFKKMSNLTAQAWTIALLTVCYFTVFTAYRGVAGLLKKRLLETPKHQNSYWAETSIRLAREEDYARQF